MACFFLRQLRITNIFLINSSLERVNGCLVIMPKSLSLNIRKGEVVRKYLHNKNLLDISYKIQVDNNRIFLPLTRSLTKNEITEIKARDPTASVLERELPEVEIPPKSHIELLSEKLSEDELKHAPRSFDTIGDIIIIEIPPELWEKRRMIGEALMEVHSNINAVYAKAGKVSGVNRIRPIEHLAGEKRTTTIYKEHGSRFAIDLKKAYFSPRLSEEHNRVASQVQPKETVVDLFCGIGPFAIPIAKKTNAVVYAIDINPDAIDFLHKNIELNKLEGKIIPYVGDCRKVVEEQSLQNIADRVIM
ncbi:MAG: methyltransferase, partial [Candidatus Heimdallarchaeota archaeon]|nr:methyltransferase [Candidatus Heimdallarchaeota archaeon]